MISLLQAALGFVGLWISVYFTGVFYKWFKPDVFWIPHICRLEEKTCLTVLDTPRAKLFGVPNSAFGIGVYSYVIVDAFVFGPGLGLVLISLALIRSVYLAYSLIFVTKIPCVLCFTSHAVNLALFVLYLCKFLGLC